MQTLHTLVVPTNATEFWTAVVALATLGLIYTAWRGLRSLGLSKNDMITRATRDARQSAITRCEEWASVILPMNVPLLEQISGAPTPIPVFVRDQNKVRFTETDPAELARAVAWIATLPQGLLSEIIGFLNRVEAWAMYFAHELADEAVAYGPLAPSFFQVVVQYYPVLVVLRSNVGSGKYPNTIQLFEGWLSRKAKSERELQLRGVLEQLDQLQRSGSSHRELPRPLGTNID